ncbi:Unknown protein [Striga hermonthica]|uniref:Uncharacterized protein n=1 Tax=Striga hermonthica TaxID=68872 RepID=A0A9N7RAW6_STRHE|nr:Unknown protein [Striga hermonthica]
MKLKPLICQTGWTHLFLFIVFYQFKSQGRIRRAQCFPWARYSLETERKRSYLEKQKVLHLLVTFAAQNSDRDSNTLNNGLVGVDALAKLFLQKVLHLLVNFAAQNSGLDNSTLSNGLAGLMLLQSYFP